MAPFPNMRPIEAIAFSDEEGRFGGLFGSQALAGQVTPGYLHSARDLNGVTLVDAMAVHGMDARAALHAQRTTDSIHAYVELHIEQGPVLDRQGVSVGIVDAITGQLNYQVT